MLDNLKRWLATNHVVAFLVIAASIAGAVGFFVALHMSWHDGLKILSPGNYNYSFWMQTLIYIASLTLVIATLEGLLGCAHNHALTLEAWWPRMRSGLQVASIPVWLSWLNIVLERQSTSLHSKWVGTVKSLDRPGQTLLFLIAIVLVVWVCVFHIVVPAVHAFTKPSAE